MKTFQSRQGFTLVELLVVIAMRKSQKPLKQFSPSMVQTVQVQFLTSWKSLRA
ncbi:MAG: hypothetical protein COA78_15950 [Blastopirellula sp.]|nr:MAG: hypothetical protein COA78_15950 [Blastopirellula sp.]